MITLVAILCHSLANIPVCIDEVVPTDFAMMAGKVDHQIPMEFTVVLCKTKGEEIIAEWMINNPKYRNWKLQGFECVQGQYNSSKRA